MSNAIRIVAVFFVLSIVGCSSTPNGPELDSPVGVWNKTSFHGVSDSSASGISIQSFWETIIKINVLDEEYATYKAQANEEGFVLSTPLNSGRIYFTSVDKQGKWQGYWVEDEAWNTENYKHREGIGNVRFHSPIECKYEKYGSLYWGFVEFEFTSGNNKMKSIWDKCGNGSKFYVLGSRVRYI